MRDLNVGGFMLGSDMKIQFIKLYFLLLTNMQLMLIYTSSYSPTLEWLYKIVIKNVDSEVWV